MNPAAILNSQFVQVSLPIVFTLAFGIWFNNKRIDDLRADLNRFESNVDARFDRVDARFERVDARFDRVDTRFDRLEALLNGLEQRVTRVEERTSNSRWRGPTLTMPLANRDR